MKLYRTKGTDDEGQVKYRWDGTQADAGKQRKDMKQEGFTDVETDDVDVPTSKAELLAWLNENCNQPGE